MKVLAIDPGYDRVGAAVVELAQKKEHLHYSACITTDKTAMLSDRLHTVGNEIERLIEEFAPTALAIETLFFNANQKTAIAVAAARGVVIFLAARHGLTVYEFGPQEIKVAMTGYGKSDKRAVYDMVKRLLPGAPPTGLDDEYDAIAIGITCLAHHGRSR